MDDDWDLHAVVRGCAAAVTTTRSSTTTTNNPFLPSFPSNFPSHDDHNSSFDFPGLIDDRNDADPFQGLQEIYQEFCVNDPTPTIITAAATDISATELMPIPAAHVFQSHQEIVQIKPALQMNMQIQGNVQFNNPMLNSSPQKFPATVPQPIRPRRRKNQQMKMVRQMTQEELSADSWAWRKYGQKPIKGSPYPRNYYRCSTSKGCAARKQVERSPNDPGIFEVSYTGEHTHPRPTHRSSLSGSSRSKFSSSPAVAVRNNNNNALLFQKGSFSSSSPSGSSFSPNTPSMEGEATAQNEDVEMAEEEDVAGDEDNENIVVIPNDFMNDDVDDMFRGFQDSDHSSGGGGDFFSSGLLASPPWSPTGSVGNAATFNGGGGR